MQLSRIIDGVPDATSRGPLDLEIESLAYDSRRVRPGSLFFAYDGSVRDGHDYIDEAVSRGAVAVVHRDEIAHRTGVGFIRVKNPRFAMASMSANFFRRPSREMKIIGVTGTNGKSSVAFFISQLLDRVGCSNGLLSTTFLKIAESLGSTPFSASTPEAPEVQDVLRRIADSGCEYAVIEATSHALSAQNNRLGSIEFNCAVCTNLSHEHLEFHGSREQYRFDKANLFRALDGGQTPAVGIVNADSNDADYFSNATASPVYSFGVASAADLTAIPIESDLSESRFELVSGSSKFEVMTSLAGSFNIENILAAILTVSVMTGRGIDQLQRHVASMKPVPGRLQRIDMGQPFRLIVDFAHSPDSFSRLLPFVRKHTSGRLIVVFGSAGDRDVAKRPLQGAVADQHADVLVLTDEDPRGESPEAILREIAKGCSARREGEDLYIVPNRSRAIELALGMAKTGDNVLLLGKGHEKSIEYRNGLMEWNEVEVAKASLRKFGY